MLSVEQQVRWGRDGLLILPGFVPLGECDELARRANEIVARWEPETVSVFTTRDQVRRSDDYFLSSGDKVRCFFEEDAFGPDGRLRVPKERAINKIGHALHDLDPAFERFSRAPRVAEVTADLGVRDPVLIQSMYIFKQPRIGGEVTAHQDQTFLWTEPPSVIGFWFALEDATRDNGCLWVLRGGHTIPARRRFRRAPGGGTTMDVLDPEPLPTEEMVPLEVTKGTCVVMHGLLPHRSGANRSPTSRHAYTLHVMERAAKYPADNWLQRGRDLPLRGF